MARRRFISSAIDRDEWFGQLDFFERDFWRVLLTTCADDQGRILDNTILIRSDAYPYKDVPLADVESALELFERADWRIYRYEADGKRLIQILNWWEHQPMQWAAASKFPPPAGWQDRVRTREGNQFIENNWGTQAERSAQCEQYRSLLRQTNGEPNRSADSGPNDSPHGGPSRQVPRSPLPVSIHVPAGGPADGAGVAAPPPPRERKRSAHDQARLALEVHFAQATGLPRPEANTDKQKRAAASLWYGPLRDIAELAAWDVGEATRLIDAALAQLDGNCTVASPKSIAATALAIHTGNAPRANGARASPSEPAGFVGLREYAKQEGIDLPKVMHGDTS